MSPPAPGAIPVSERAVLAGTYPQAMAATVPRPGSPVVPAATVAVVRDGDSGLEALLVHRNPDGAFAGLWVFPGGRVDDGDLEGSTEGSSPTGAAAASEPGRRPDVAASGAEDEIAAARRAAVREAREEAGLQLDPDRLAVLSWWLPPAEVTRRFATWFFVAPANPGDPVVVDRTEVHDHAWVGPAEALARRDRGAISLAPPTWMTLHWLSQHHDVASVLTAAGSRAPERFVTRVGRSPSGQVAATLWEGDAGYEDGVLDRPGPRRRLVTDDRGWHFESTSA
jgi:8-oxo-dGTP pyrophosphatase MutT (NUDIX family)